MPVPSRARLIRKKQPNDQVSALDFNLLVELCSRTISGPGVIETSAGWFIMPQGFGGGAATAVFMKVSGHSGSEPGYRYSGKEVELTGTNPTLPASWTDKDGGIDFSYNGINSNEIGPMGAGVSPLEEGDIMILFKAGDFYVGSALNFKGEW